MAYSTKVRYEFITHTGQTIEGEFTHVNNGRFPSHLEDGDQAIFMIEEDAGHAISELTELETRSRVIAPC